MLSYLLCQPCCHYRCPERWDLESKAHNASGALAAQCFGDNGENADWRWLFQSYPHARFVLTVRPHDELAASLAAHLRKARLAANCSADGDDASCQAVPFASNTPKRLHLRLKRIRAHEQEVLRFFNATAERRSRFVQLDLAHSQPREAWLALLWVLRPDLRTSPAAALVTSARELPAAFLAAMEDHEIKHLPLPHISSNQDKRSLQLKGGCYLRHLPNMTRPAMRDGLGKIYLHPSML